MDFEEQLENMIRSHTLEKHDRLKDRITNYVLQLVEEKLLGTERRLVIRGVPEYAMEEVYALISAKATVVAFLNKQSKHSSIRVNHRSIPILHPTETVHLQFDGYLIFSYTQASIIMEEVEQSEFYDANIAIINLYDEINIKYGFYCEKSYFEYTDEIDYSHQAMTEAMIAWRESKNHLEKKKNLWNLLGTCLAHRDFYLFFAFASENEIPEVEEELKKIVKEVQALLDAMKQMISKRKYQYRDIIIHWVDQVPYDELNLLPKLRKRISQGWMFENAFTVTPYTTPTMNTIFWKDLRGITQTEYIGRNWRESPLGKYLTTLGYYMDDIGAMEKRLKIGEEYCKDTVEYSVCTTLCYWKAILQLIQIEQPLFLIIHTLCETHDPYISPGLQQIRTVYSFNNTYDQVYEQMKLSYGYLDNEIEFYSDIIGNNNIGIYMSDHGKWEDVSLRRFYDKAIHTFFGVTNIGIHKQEKKIFSYLQFLELMIYLTTETKETYDAIWQDICFFCDIAIYGVGIKCRLKKLGLEGSELCQSYSGVRDSQGKYVRMEDGQEHYFVIPDEEREEVNNPQLFPRIEKLRKIHKEFIGEVFGTF